jgi:hypothetical protein
MDQQDTGKFRKNTKDQYYTKFSVAKQCVDQIVRLFPHTNSYQWIEPSAGNGVFLRALPDSITDKLGIDIDPKSAEVQRADFLTWSPTDVVTRVFFGNPPFGRQGSLAKSFIKHSAAHAQIIAFILPRSFVKPSMSKAFPLAFHCVYTADIDKNAFEVNDNSYDVPCVFQIWEKRAYPREIPPPIKESGFTYVKKTEPFHIACKRVGGLAGKCYPCSPTASLDYHAEYHYFLRLDENHIPQLQPIINAMNAHVFPSNTVGPRSLSKSEINEVLNLVLREEAQGAPASSS